MVFVELHSIHHVGVPSNQYDGCHDRDYNCDTENDNVRKLYNLIADQYGLDYKESFFDEAFHRASDLIIRPFASEAANFVAKALSLRLREADVCILC